jgi:glycosyltransferase involved in cell wall biosynthesis
MRGVALLLFVADSVTDEDFQALRASAELEKHDGRIVIRRGISGLSPAEMSREVESAWVAFVSAPIIFLKSGAQNLVSVLEGTGDSEALYFNSIDHSGEKLLRPVFSPERLRSQLYVGELVVFRGSTFGKLANLRSQFDRATPYELILKAAEQKIDVQHVAEFLYKSVSEGAPLVEGTSSWRVTQSVLESHMGRTGGGTVTWNNQSARFETARSVVGAPLVSIVIPTRGVRIPGFGPHSCVVVSAIRSIIEKTAYLNYEIVLVVDDVAEEGVLLEIAQLAGSKLKLVPWNQPFNFSQKMNFGVLHSSGEYVLLLNDDVEVLNDNWLESLLALAQLPNAGMVGAMLYYEDETIQHGGHSYFRGSPTHIGLGLARGSRGPQDSFLVDREVSGVTAACAMMPREVFDHVGGFTALLPGNFNDVDLCLKVGWKGFDIYWTPRAELYHFESKTRDAHVHYYELDVIEHRWGLRLDDPRYWPWLPWAVK